MYEDPHTKIFSSFLFTITRDGGNVLHMMNNTMNTEAAAHPKYEAAVAKANATWSRADTKNMWKDFFDALYTCKTCGQPFSGPASEKHCS